MQVFEPPSYRPFPVEKKKGEKKERGVSRVKFREETNLNWPLTPRGEVDGGKRLICKRQARQLDGSSSEGALFKNEASTFLTSRLVLSTE